MVIVSRNDAIIHFQIVAVEIFLGDALHWLFQFWKFVLVEEAKRWASNRLDLSQWVF